jgi:hypothetical protein
VQSASAGGAGNIYVINANGTNNQLLVTNGSQPAWSPGQGTIAFIQGIDVYTISSSGGSGVTNITNLTPGLAASYPAFSPTGKLAYVETPGASGSTSDIHLINLDGTGDTVFVSNGTQPTFRAFSGAMAFIRSGDIYTVNTFGTNPAQLTSTGTNSSPSWGG